MINSQSEGKHHSNPDQLKIADTNQTDQSNIHNQEVIAL